MYNNNFRQQNNSSKVYKQQNKKVGDFYNPYGFVPLSEKVFTMTDKEKEMLQYCHDIPFKEGMSGSFDVTFEAVTPFCIASRKEEESSTCYFVKRYKGEEVEEPQQVVHNVGKCPKMGDDFYVPGSSIKGMIQNVFRIISFGKIGEYAEDNRYSLRDLRADSEDYDLNKENPDSGFLVKLNNDYYVLPCDNQKMTYEEIASKTRDQRLITVLKDTRKSLRDKYGAINRYYFSENQKHFMWFFSGYMQGFSERNPGKLHEHLFEIHQNKIKEDNLIPVSKKTWEEFTFIHQVENENKSWSFWREKLKNYRTFEQLMDEGVKFLVPVFFRKDDMGVKDFGFSRLYRQPYRNSIHQCLPDSHKRGEKIDLSQAVFGYSNKEGSLKGRVRFSNAICKNTKELSPVFITPGSPKPNYYPFYLKQYTGKRLRTYGTEGAQIQGWKRFLIHSKEKPSEKFTNNKIQSAFRPLQAGTTFTCRISYHNLRPFELGALIQAVDFLGETDVFHTIGYAKPFGYGKIKVQDIKLSNAQDDTREDFENELESRTGISIVDDKNKFYYVFSQLLFLASDDYNQNKITRYPYMADKGKGIENEFKLIKDDNKNLTNFNPEV